MYCEWDVANDPHLKERGSKGLNVGDLCGGTSDRKPLWKMDPECNVGVDSSKRTPLAPAIPVSNISNDLLEEHFVERKEFPLYIMARVDSPVCVFR